MKWYETLITAVFTVSIFILAAVGAVTLIDDPDALRRDLCVTTK